MLQRSCYQPSSRSSAAERLATMPFYARPNRHIRPIQITGDIALVPLTRGLFATIDAADAYLAEGVNWSAVKGNKTWYAITTQKRSNVNIFLHRKLLLAPDGVIVDHKDRDGLNCRRSNIRLATKSLNAHNCGLLINNTSGVKGVCWDKRVKKWVARIYIMGRCRHLGRFDDIEEAAAVYAAALDAHLKGFE